MAPITNAQLAERITAAAHLHTVELQAVEDRLGGRIDHLADTVVRQNGSIGILNTEVEELKEAKVGTDAVAKTLKESEARSWTHWQIILAAGAAVAGSLAGAGGLLELITRLG
jgi:hypothetical protein